MWAFFCRKAEKPLEFLRSILNKDTILLGNKKAEVKKLTPAIWKKAFGAVDTIPGLVLSLIQAPKQDLAAYLIQAFDMALDEMLEIISVITGIEKKYLHDEAGLDELIEYIYLTIKKNRIDQTAKNLKSLLKKQVQKQEE